MAHPEDAMPIWISQDTVTADTTRNRTRTAWLDPLQDRIQAAIRAYVQEHPGGEEVTLAVFDAIPPADVAPLLPRGRTIDAGRRELGLRVPLELIAMYGAGAVETSRRDDGHTASPRRTNRDWPRNFTPHRVVLAPSPRRACHNIAFRDFEEPELWRDILDSWLGVLADYRAAADDLGWWHGPAACAGQLAGAIWRLPGAVCIDAPPTAGPRPVQGDLWFSVGGTPAVVAVRDIWPQTPAGAAAALSRTLDHAAWQLDARDVSDRFVACFVVPTLRASEEAMAEAGAVLDAAWEAAGSAGMARLLGHDDPLALAARGGVVYPGVMLVIRRV